MAFGISISGRKLVFPIAVEVSSASWQAGGSDRVPHSKNTTDGSGVISEENSAKRNEHALRIAESALGQRRRQREPRERAEALGGS